MRLLVWLDIGIFIYWFYGRKHSPLADPAERQHARPLEGVGNFVTMLGALALFNGVFIAILGFMTTFGLTSEATAKWHEINVTPESADVARVDGPGDWSRPAGPRPRDDARPGHG